MCGQLTRMSMATIPSQKNKYKFIQHLKSNIKFNGLKNNFHKSDSNFQ